MANLTINDLIRVNTSVAARDSLTTASGDLAAILDGVVFNVADRTGTVVAVNDTATIDGVTYTVTKAGFSDFTIGTAGGGTGPSSGNGLIELTAAGATHPTITLLSINDKNGTLTDINSVSVTSVPDSKSTFDPSAHEVINHNHTLDSGRAGGQTETIPDAIFSLTPTGDRGTTALDHPADLLSVQDSLVIDVSTAGSISRDDTFVVDGTTYHVLSVSAYNAAITYNSGATANPDIVEIRFATTAGGAEAGKLIVPADHEGNFTDITQITVNNAAPQAANFTISSIDTDQTVTLPSSGGGGGGGLLYDFIEVNPASTIADGVTLTTGPDLVKVHDDVIPEAVSGTITAGQGFAIGSTTYIVSSATEYAAVATDSSGTTSSEALYEIVATVQATGATAKFLVVQDSTGDAIDISSLSLSGVFSPTAPVWENIDTQDNVSLATGKAASFDMYDAIEWDGTSINSGAVTLTNTTHLSPVVEPINIAGDQGDGIDLEVGDDTVIGTSPGQVTGVGTTTATITHSGGTVTPGVTVFSVVINDNGTTRYFLVPEDGQGAFPNITSMQMSGTVSNATSGLTSGKVDTDETVSVATGPTPDGVVDGENIGEVMNQNAYVDAQGDAITTGNDVIYGNGGDDNIGSSDGDDLVYGGAGDDTIAGDETGEKTLFGGVGNDTFGIKGGVDRDIAYGGEHNDTFTVNGGDAYGGDDVDTFTISGATNDISNVYGGSTGTDNDTLNLDAGWTVNNFIKETDGNQGYTGTATHTDGGQVNFTDIETINVGGNAFEPKIDLYDAIDITGATYTEGATLNVGSDLKSIIDDFQLLPVQSNKAQVNDDIVIGSTTYNIDSITFVSTPTVTFDGGSTASPKIGILELSSGGSTKTIMIMEDGDYPLISSIQISGSAVAPDINPQAVDVDDNVSLFSTGPSNGAVDGEEAGETMGVGYDDADPTNNNGANPPTNGGGDLITESSDMIYGNGGDDNIDAGGGDDTVFGGNGADTINGRDGNDILYGDGADLIYNASGVVVDGSDVIYGNNGDDILFGGGENDTLQGGADNDTLYGGDGDDNVYGSTGDDVIYAGDNDNVYGGTDSGNDNDSLYLEAGWTLGALTVENNGKQGVNGTATDGAGKTVTFTDIENIYIDGVKQTLPDGAVDGEAASEIMGVGYDDNAVNSGQANTTNGGGDQITNGDDLIYGNAGNDTITAGGGNDVIYGGANQDIFYGGTGNDVAYGGDAQDQIYIDNNSGNDVFYGGSGSNEQNIFDASAVTTNGTLNFTGGDDGTFQFGATTTTFENTQQINAGSGDDTINASLMADGTRLNASEGDDTITAGTDGFSISGGAGNDTVIASEGALGADTTAGGYETDFSFGNDTYDASAVTSDLTLTGTATRGGSNQFQTTDGVDTINIDGFETIKTGSGDDVVNVGSGSAAQTIETNAGNDTVTGGSGADTINAGAGNDTVFGGDGADTVTGGAGEDAITGGDGADILYGGDNRDTFFGGADDLIYGGSTAGGGSDYDTLELAAGWTIDSWAPEASGGKGYDGTAKSASGESITFKDIETIKIDGTTWRPEFPVKDIIVSTTDAGAGTLTSGVELEAWSDNLNMTLSDSSKIQVDDTLEYNGTTYELKTFTQFNAPTTYDGGTTTTSTEFFRIEALGVGGPGSGGTKFFFIPKDTQGDRDDITQIGAVTGGNTLTEILTADVSTDDTVELDGSVPDGIVDGEDSGELMTITSGPAGGAYIDDAALDTNGDAALDDGGGDQITEASDTIMGNGGDDIIDGAGGDDLIYGGTGKDNVSGSAGEDVIYGNEADDSLFGGADNDILYGGIGLDSIEGDDGRDILYGDAGEDILYGEAGNDTIYGGSELDIIYGGGDRDYVYGGDGKDQIDGGDGNDILYGEVGEDIIEGGANNDIAYGGSEEDLIFGGADEDLLYGGTTGDEVYGGTGNDDIFGGAGNDQLIGGEDNDCIDGSDGDDFIFGDEPESVTIGSGQTQGSSNSGATGADPSTLADGSQWTFEMQFTGDEVPQVGPVDGVGGNYPGTPNSAPTGQADTTTLLSYGTSFTLAAQSDVEYYNFPQPNAGNDTSTTVEPGNVVISFMDSNGDMNTVETSILSSTILDDPNATTMAVVATEDTLTIYVNGAVAETIDVDLLTGGETVDLPLTGDVTIGNNAAQDDGFTGTVTDVRLWDDPRTLEEIQQFHNTDLDDESSDVNLVSNWVADPFNPGSFLDDVGENHAGGFGNNELNVSGNQGDDKLIGDAGNDTIIGAGGEDELFGGADNDKLYGGTENDEIDAGSGNDEVYGGMNNDTIFAGEGTDQIFGGGEGDAQSIDVDTLDISSYMQPGYTAEYSNVELDTATGGNGNGFNGVITIKDGSGATIGVLNFDDIEEFAGIGAPPCFTPGTMIKTKTGETKVEDLQVGDKVLTRDNGYQTVRWIGSRELSDGVLALKQELRPIRIAKGALGGDLPERDMIVSPQHRMLVGNAETELWFGSEEVLVAAKHMTVLDGVSEAPIEDVTYIHVMFDAHEIICADGSWTESFQPGDLTLTGLDEAARAELYVLFPELRTDSVTAFPAARPSLKAHEAAMVLAAE